MASTELKTIDVELADDTTYQLPYWQVDSGNPGPRVLITAALHGSELQGSEVLRRFLPEAEQGVVRGGCYLLPLANPEAIRRRQPHIDFEHGRYYGRDNVNNVNCTWPGKADGSSGQRLSHALFQSLVQDADCLLDIHCWQHLRAATGLARTGRQDSIDLVNAAAPPFGRHGQWQPEVKERPITPCTLTSYFHDTDRTAMSLELSGQYGFWPEQLTLGMQIVRNALRHLGVMDGEPEAPLHPTVWLNDTTKVDVVAPCKGVFVPAEHALSDWVQAGARVGHIFTIDDLGTVDVLAPAAGYLHRLGPTHDVGNEQTRMFMHPYVDEGQVVAELAG
jgi:predicted deacylase